MGMPLLLIGWILLLTSRDCWAHARWIAGTVAIVLAGVCFVVSIKLNLT